MFTTAPAVERLLGSIRVVFAAVQSVNLHAA
jgi:hypothetical protein